MHALRFGRVRWAMGALWVAETDRGIVACSTAEDPAELLRGLRRRFGALAAEPADVGDAWLFDGSAPQLDLRGLPRFDARVYEAVHAVPAGQTVTYGEVAVLVGSPGAARAVGNAMARCPLFPAVPCHRVVRASDGWSGWGGDPAVKRRMLVREAGRGG